MTSKKLFLSTLLLFIFWCGSAQSYFPWSRGYDHELKRWTRGDKVYVWDNLEARVVWKATYLSSDLVRSQQTKLTKMYDWDASEQLRFEKEHAVDARYDVFIVSIYMGSSEYSALGKDDGRWKLVLEQNGRSADMLSMEKLSLNTELITLYPYLDKWSQVYRVTFPKTLSGDKDFSLTLFGAPEKTSLVWK